MVIPGARMQMIVVRKLTDPGIVPRPPSVKPSNQRSPPTPGVYTAPDSGAYANQPKSAAPSGVKKLNSTTRATEQIQPVGQHVEPRECDVRGTDLQQHDRVGERREQRCRKGRSITEPCMVNIWLYCSFEMNCWPGFVSSARISSAMMPPMKKVIDVMK